MDMSTTTVTPSATATATAAAAAATAGVNTPEADTETPTRIQPTKPLPFGAGVFKRHHPLHHLHHHHHHHQNNPPIAVIYKECLKNHAASLGGHAVDGCGEFMPSPTANPSDPTSLKCAACGCHRNFHRRDPEEPPLPPNTAVIEYQPHHRHHPPPPPPHGGDLVVGPNSPSPPPISSSYAPHMLLALKAGLPVPLAETNGTPPTQHHHKAKRFRTKFTQEQKSRMFEFAEKVGWRIQKGDEEIINEFCSEVGVDRGVLKVWMHNNKNTLGKRDHDGNVTANINEIGGGNLTLDGALVTDYNNNDIGRRIESPSNHIHKNDSVSTHAVATNGSSSSS